MRAFWQARHRLAVISDSGPMPTSGRSLSIAGPPRDRSHALRCAVLYLLYAASWSREVTRTLSTPSRRADDLHDFTDLSELTPTTPIWTFGSVAARTSGFGWCLTGARAGPGRDRSPHLSARPWRARRPCLGQGLLPGVEPQPGRRGLTPDAGSQLRSRVVAGLVSRRADGELPRIFTRTTSALGPRPGHVPVLCWPRRRRHDAAVPGAATYGRIGP